MKRLMGAVSLIAIFASSVGVFAEEKSYSARSAVETKSGLPQELQELLADGRPTQELSDADLRRRFRAARDAGQIKGLPPGILAQVVALYKESKLEIRRREQAGAPAEDQVQERRTTRAEQPEQPARDAAVQEQPRISPRIRALLEDDRALDTIPAPELSARVKQAFAYSRDDNLPGNVRKRLAQISAADRKELQRRQGVESPSREEDKAVVIVVPRVVRSILSDDRPRDTIPAQELLARSRQAAAFAEAGDTPREFRRKLADVAQADRTELKRRQTAEQPREQPRVQPEADTMPREVRLLLRDRRSGDEMPTAELRTRFRQATALSESGDLPRDVRRQLASMAETDRNELRRRERGADKPTVDGVIEVTPPPRDRPNEIVVEGQQDFDPRAERQARQILQGARADSMDGRSLRNRLNVMRELLATNALDPRTSRELRRQLLSDRDILRQRVALEQAEGDPATGVTSVRPRRPVNSSDGGIDIRIILGDRRRGDDLSREELQRRIQVYRDIERDAAYERYGDDERARWRETMAQDRDILRRRLLRERDERSNELTLDLNRGKLDIELGIGVPSSRARDVFAAEADDQEIEEILVAPPTARPTRRYTVEEIADDRTIRQSLPRLEIDTVKFGFNEAFVREEELSSLDRIAAVMERILKKYPREVFLIEGHTDAVGSDVYNLGLSRARAEAIKRALTTFYVIPAQSLRTAGLGERYLKIPTPEAEPENRRVSISRITQYIGSAE
jgi:outer membrane protein OmpA-like peptidoglycan-associated protein